MMTQEELDALLNGDINEMADATEASADGEQEESEDFNLAIENDIVKADSLYDKMLIDRHLHQQKNIKLCINLMM